MLVLDLFTFKPAFCWPDTNLAAAAALLWEHDCGALPVLDAETRVIGILTDRDICMAVGTRGRLASDLAVRDVMTPAVLTCRPEDSVSTALRIMREGRVRRLPVVNNDRALMGMISINDLVLAAKRQGGVAIEELLMTLRVISAHPTRPRQEADAPKLIVA